MGQPAPVKKSNPLVWVGLGCGALLFLGAAGAWGVYAFVVRPVQEAEAAASAIANTGASITVGDGGVVLNMPGVGQITAPTSEPEGEKARAPSGGTLNPGSGTTLAPSPSGTTATNPALPVIDAGALATGGATCVQAAACCHAVMEKTGAGAQAAACDQMKSMPEVGCVQALATYRKTAPLVGAKCP